MKYFYCFILAFILFTACTKTEYIHTPVTEEFKQWCVFQPGSYWVYQNDSTSVTDCTYITAMPEWFVEESGTSTENHGLGDQKVIHTYDVVRIRFEGGFLNSYTITSDPSILTCAHQPGRVYFTRKSRMNYSENFIAFQNHFSFGCWESTPPYRSKYNVGGQYKSTVLEKFKEYSINGQIYPGVSHIITIGVSDPFQDTNHVYYSKGYGLIRIVKSHFEWTTDSIHRWIESHSLLRSNIVQ